MIHPGQDIFCSEREEAEEAEVGEEEEVTGVVYTQQCGKMCPIYFSGGRK